MDAESMPNTSYDYETSHHIDIPRFEEECDISASLGAELEASGLEMAIDSLHVDHGDDSGPGGNAAEYPRAGPSGENAQALEDDDDLVPTEPRFKYLRVMNDAPKVDTSVVFKMLTQACLAIYGQQGKGFLPSSPRQVYRCWLRLWPHLHLRHRRQ